MNVKILTAIGNTPLIELENCWIKCEWRNPSGSIKDRVAHYIVEKAEKEGRLKPGDTLIEATSGNMGNALAMIAAAKGYRCIVFSPKGMSRERNAIATAFGADVREVGMFHVDEARQAAFEMSQKPHTFYTDQFVNLDNLEENITCLGYEIIQQIPAGIRFDATVQGVGTGGTLLGVGRALKEQHNPNIRLFAVEPEESKTLGVGEVGVHCIEGISDGFVPKLYADHQEQVEGVIAIKSQDAIECMKDLAKAHGLLVGPSSGANFLAVQEVKRRYPEIDHVLTFFCDEGEKYLSEYW